MYSLCHAIKFTWTQDQNIRITNTFSSCVNAVFDLFLESTRVLLTTSQVP